MNKQPTRIEISGEDLNWEIIKIGINQSPNMIRKLKDSYRVVTESGRNLGEYDTKKEAEERDRELESRKIKN